MDVVPPPSEPDAPPAPATRATRPSGEADHRAVTIVTIVACVAIIAVIGGAMAIDGGGGDVASATPAAPSPTAVAAPQTMDAHPAAFVVVLTWARGEGLPVSYYAVTRDGRPVTTLKPDTTTWIDRSVTPETRYVYMVAAVGADGTRALTRVVAKTPTAPLSTARPPPPHVRLRVLELPRREPDRRMAIDAHVSEGSVRHGARRSASEGVRAHADPERRHVSGDGLDQRDREVRRRRCHIHLHGQRPCNGCRRGARPVGGDEGARDDDPERSRPARVHRVRRDVLGDRFVGPVGRRRCPAG